MKQKLNFTILILGSLALSACGPWYYYPEQLPVEAKKVETKAVNPQPEPSPAKQPVVAPKQTTTTPSTQTTTTVPAQTTTTVPAQTTATTPAQTTATTPAQTTATTPAQTTTTTPVQTTTTTPVQTTATTPAKAGGLEADFLKELDSILSLYRKLPLIEAHRSFPILQKLRSENEAKSKSKIVDAVFSLSNDANSMINSGEPMVQNWAISLSKEIVSFVRKWGPASVKEKRMLFPIQISQLRTISEKDSRTFLNSIEDTYVRILLVLEESVREKMAVSGIKDAVRNCRNKLNEKPANSNEFRHEITYLMSAINRAELEFEPKFSNLNAVDKTDLQAFYNSSRHFMLFGVLPSLNEAMSMSTVLSQVDAAKTTAKTTPKETKSASDNKIETHIVSVADYLKLVKRTNVLTSRIARYLTAKERVNLVHVEDSSLKLENAILTGNSYETEWNNFKVAFLAEKDWLSSYFGGEETFQKEILKEIQEVTRLVQNPGLVYGSK